MKSRFLEPPILTRVVRNVDVTSFGEGHAIIPAGAPVEIYYGDPKLDPSAYYAVRDGKGRLASVHGSALALLVEPRRVVSV